MQRRSIQHATCTVQKLQQTSPAKPQSKALWAYAEGFGESIASGVQCRQMREQPTTAPARTRAGVSIHCVLQWVLSLFAYWEQHNGCI